MARTGTHVFLRHVTYDWIALAEFAHHEGRRPTKRLALELVLQYLNVAGDLFPGPLFAGISEYRVCHELVSASRLAIQHQLPSTHGLILDQSCILCQRETSTDGGSGQTSEEGILHILRPFGTVFPSVLGRLVTILAVRVAVLK